MPNSVVKYQDKKVTLQLGDYSFVVNRKTIGEALQQINLSLGPAPSMDIMRLFHFEGDPSKVLLLFGEEVYLGCVNLYLKNLSKKFKSRTRKQIIVINTPSGGKLVL